MRKCWPDLLFAVAAVASCFLNQLMNLEVVQHRRALELQVLEDRFGLRRCVLLDD